MEAVSAYVASKPESQRCKIVSELKDFLDIEDGCLEYPGEGSQLPQVHDLRQLVHMMAGYEILKDPTHKPESAARRLRIVLEFLQFARAFAEERRRSQSGLCCRACADGTRRKPQMPDARSVGRNCDPRQEEGDGGANEGDDGRVGSCGKGGARAPR